MDYRGSIRIPCMRGMVRPAQRQKRIVMNVHGVGYNSFTPTNDNKMDNL